MCNSNKFSVVTLLSFCLFAGARWDAASHGLVDCDPGELFTRLPIVHFIPFQKTANPFGPSLIAPEGVYEMPVYKTSVRAGQLSTTGMSTNFICSIDIPLGETVRCLFVIVISPTLWMVVFTLNCCGAAVHGILGVERCRWVDSARRLS